MPPSRVMWSRGNAPRLPSRPFTRASWGLGICYLALRQARFPVLPLEISELVHDGVLPFFNTFSMLDKRLQDRLARRFTLRLWPNRSVNPDVFDRMVADLAPRLSPVPIPPFNEAALIAKVRAAPLVRGKISVKNAVCESLR